MARRAGGGPWPAVLGGLAVLLLAAICWLALYGTTSRRLHLVFNLPPARSLPFHRGPQTPPSPFPRPLSRADLPTISAAGRPPTAEESGK